MKQSSKQEHTLMLPLTIVSIIASICLVVISFECIKMHDKYKQKVAEKEALEHVLYMQRETLNETQMNYLTLNTKAKKLDETIQQVKLDNNVLTKENDNLEKEVEALKKQLQTLNESNS